MAERRREGMLLALCSKNNEEDVVETFRAHPEMPLRAGGFRRPPHQLGEQGRQPGVAGGRTGIWGWTASSWWTITPRSAREAQAAAPQVLALPLPARARGDSRCFCATSGHSTAPRVTAEDRRRAELYAQQAERARGGTRPPAAWKSFWPRSSWRSRSRPWRRPRWRAWRSSPSAPTR